MPAEHSPSGRWESNLLGPACISPHEYSPDDQTPTLSNVQGFAPSRAVERRPSQEFCPDLLVPIDSVCHLLVPTSVATSMRWSRICNRDGTALVQIMIKDSSPQCVLLRSPNGDALGEAKAASAKEFIFYNRLSQYSAKLSRNDGSDQFQLITSHGTIWNFRGRLVDFEVQVSDDSGRIVARTEKCVADRAPSRRNSADAGWGCIAKSGRAQRDSYFAAIFGPGTDVGLLLCGMLCMQILSIPQQRNSI